MAIPGFRFYPTHEELISFYLKHKIEPGTADSLKLIINNVIPELNVYDFYPSDLPQYAGERCRGDTDEWYFFIPRQKNEARGGRQSRLTSAGYWKATGSLTTVYSSSNRAIGVKRTMVFYNGRAPTGTKTKWMMNEYNAFQESSNTNGKPTVMKEFSVCRVYMKSKSMRDFDRRPTAVMINEKPPVHLQPFWNNEHHATTSSAGPSQLPSITTSLSEISQDYSDDQAVIYHPHSRSMMQSDDLPFWDWDDLERWL